MIKYEEGKIYEPIDFIKLNAMNAMIGITSKFE